MNKFWNNVNLKKKGSPKTILALCSIQKKKIYIWKNTTNKNEK